MRVKYRPSVAIQEDNTPWHKAKTVRDFLTRQKIKIISWLLQSPDLTPIENLWKQIKGRIGNREQRAKNITEIEQALREI